MEYEVWIARERKIRARILLNSDVIRKTGLCRLCQQCGEALLCHETRCPNCNSSNVVEQALDQPERQFLGDQRIRCKFRFDNLL